ncbi:S8 family peptidase [Clostridium senegalense]|uniref:S8 family peptidase n=1 Tax=Clostridium senegalense TaxID=1465809 RepID=UPI001C0FE59E|nr:S8 family peptidase [Clostridium senegalense]MBU5228181.1 S8 family peptidase [Clostridium senegalense]
MASLNKCNLYYDEDAYHFLVEYRGDFTKEINKVSYACGYAINNSLAIVVVEFENLEKLKQDVPSIIYIDFRSTFILQDISPDYADNIQTVKNNSYISLTGKDIIVGIIDTGIDYLNEEFIREDGTSRILSIWDQTIDNMGKTEDGVDYIGAVYYNEEINNAIKAHKNNEDPYKIVPSIDEVGHGTKCAGIIGARGYNKNFKGVAEDCEFVVVKLAQSANLKKRLRENKIEDIPVYDTPEIVAGLEYLRRMFQKFKKPMVIFFAVGTTEGTHDGLSLICRYLTGLGSIRGIALVTGVGNEGNSKGHVSGYIKSDESVEKIELNIPREIKLFSMNIWVSQPNRASLNIKSPSGEETKFIKSKKHNKVDFKFYYVNTAVNINYYDPEHFTGHQVINIVFKDIKPGIWEFNLIGDYIVDGRYDIWLPPSITLPKGTEFLNPDPYSTLTVPSTSLGVITSTYYGENNGILASSGKGFNTNNMPNPDLATIGSNVLTVDPLKQVVTMSGSSAATSIIAGACALLLQWGIVNGNDTTMYSTKVKSYLIYGAYKNPIYKFPNRDIGYGALDLLGIFNIIGRLYKGNYRSMKNNILQYNIGDLFIRMPQEFRED